MKTFLASLFMAFIFTLSLGIILLIWDINVFQYVDITKILLTILTIVVSSLILCLVWAFFFNNGKYRDDKKEGNVAQIKEK